MLFFGFYDVTMNIGAGETMYLVLPEDEDIEVTGTVNLMLVK